MDDPCRTPLELRIEAASAFAVSHSGECLGPQACHRYHLAHHCTYSGMPEDGRTTPTLGSLSHLQTQIPEIALSKVIATR